MLGIGFFDKGMSRKGYVDQWSICSVNQQNLVFSEQKKNSEIK